MVVLQALGLGQGAAQAEPRQYTLNPKASEIAVHVGKAGLFRFAGHEQDVVAGHFRGTVNVDPERRRSSVEITVDAASLRVTGSGESAKDVQAKMLGPKCLDVARFPSIRFVSKTVTEDHGPAGVRNISIRGDLHPARRDARDHAAGSVGARAGFDAGDRRDNPPSKGLRHRPDLDRRRGQRQERAGPAMAIRRPARAQPEPVTRTVLRRGGRRCNSCASAPRGCWSASAGTRVASNVLLSGARRTSWVERQTEPELAWAS